MKANHDGAIKMGVGTVKLAASGSATKTYTFEEPMASAAIYNDGASDIALTVGGYTLTIKPTEVVDELFDPFTSLTVTSTATAYRLIVRG